MQWGNRQPKIIQKVWDRDKNNWWVYEDKSYCLPTNPMSDRWQMVLEKERIRKLTPLECMRLQWLPDWYCSNIVSNSQQYKMIGNWFTVPVIAHIFSFIK
jgi:site-specific DNA-cytosine methylase